MDKLTNSELKEILRREYGISSPKKATKKKLLSELGKAKAKVMRQKEQENSEEPEQRENSENSEEPEQRKNVAVVQLYDPKEQLIRCPPNKCTEGVFKANNPFIRVMSTSSTQQKRVDKFKGTCMDSDILFSFMQAFERDVLKASFSVGDATSEQGGQEIHGALFRGFSEVTRPSLGLLEKLELRQQDYEREHKHKCKRPRYTDEQVMCGQRGYHLEAPPQPAVDEEMDEPGSQESDKSDNRGYFIGLGRPDLGAGDKGWGFMDFFVAVEDYRPENLPPLTAAQQFNPKKYVLTKERKWEKDGTAENAVYQGGCYCVQGVRANLLRGHKTPVYDLVVCSKEWTYAKLEIRGIIKIGEDGEISEASYKDYAMLEKSIGYTEREKLSYAELRGLLESSRMFAESKYPNESNEQVKYPQGAYIVGDFFVAPEWFNLPNAQEFYTQGGRKFYEGLLRIFLGDSVLKWTLQDVESVKKLNEDVLSEFQYLLRDGRTLSGQKRKLQ